MNVHLVFLLKQMIESLASMIVVLTILIKIVISNWKFDVWFDSLLLVPCLDLIFVETSLQHFLIWHQIQYSCDLTVLYHLLNINLVEWKTTNNYVVLSTLLNNLVEEKSVKESTVSLFNDAVNDFDHIFALEMWGWADFWVTKLALVGVWIFDEESTVWSSLFDLETTNLLLFAVSVCEVGVVIFIELSFAISMLVLQWNYAFPKLIWFAIFWSEPLLGISGPLHLDWVLQPWCWVWNEEHLITLFI